MLTLGINLEAAPLTSEEKVLHDALHTKGNEAWTLMSRLLPNRGYLVPKRTREADYLPGSADSRGTKLKLRLERDTNDGVGLIRLMLKQVPIAQPGSSDEGEVTQEVAAVNANGHLVGKKYYDLFPTQRLEVLEQALEAVQIIADQFPTVPAQQLGQTALHE